jgi:hypothetical protein
MARPFEDEEDPTPRSVPPKKPAPPKPQPPGASAKPPQQKPGVPMSPVQPTGPTRLAWGHAGSVNTPGELSDLTGRPGVIRLVGAGIHYEAPPLDRHVWLPALEQPGRFEMPWTEGDPAEVPSLGDLAAGVRSSPTPAKLREIDAAADALLSNTEKLHEQGWRLGLLHLANVLVVPNTQGREVVLPDLGFTWRGAHGSPPWKDSPGRPAWLEEDRAANRNAWLWDEAPVVQQFPCENQYGTDLISESADLKTLARLFASLYTGRPEREVPRSPTAAPVWATLHAVMSGEIATAGQFRDALKKTPLGTLWSTPKELPKPKKSKVPVMLLLLFLFLLCGGVPAALLGAWKMGWLATDVPTSPSSRLAIATGTGTKKTEPITPTTKVKPPNGPPKRPEKDVPWKSKPAGAIPNDSELNALKKEFDAAKDPKLRADILNRMYKINLLNDPALREREWHWIEYLRGVYLAEWVDRYKAHDAVVQKDVSKRFEIAKDISELNRELDTLRQSSPPYTSTLDEREKQCLEISTLRVTELGSPR